MGNVAIWRSQFLQSLARKGIRMPDNRYVLWGSGNPNGVETADPGSIFFDRVSPSSAWLKETGTGNTGWVQLSSGSNLPFIVVDAAGNWDYTEIDTAINTEPANTIFLVLPGSYTSLATAALKIGHRIFGAAKGSVLWDLDVFTITSPGGVANNNLLDSLDISGGSSTIFFSDGTKVQDCYFDCTGTAYAYIATATSGVPILQTGVEIENCKFLLSTSAGSSALVIGGGGSDNNIRVRNTTFFGNGGTPDPCVRIRNASSNINFEGCNFANLLYAIATDGGGHSGTNIKISNCVFDTIVGAVMANGGTFNTVKIENCTVTSGASGTGIFVIEVNNNCSISNVQMIDCESAIFLDGDNSVISNIEIQDSAGAPAMLKGISIDGDYNRVCNSILNVPSGDAIDVLGGISNNFVGNMTTGSVLDAGDQTIFVNQFPFRNCGNLFSYDTTSQTLAAAGTNVTFDTDSIIEGFTRATADQFVAARDGLYQVSFSAQLAKAAGLAEESSLWLTVGGSEVAGTRIRETIGVIATNYFVSKTVLVSLSQGDVLRVRGESASSGVSVSDTSGDPSASIAIQRLV